MNKRGITLVEVIISVGLISVVMLFLFRLLLDMQFEDAHTSYAKENQVNRAMIIKTVQEDFLNKHLQNIQNNSGVITFTFQEQTKTLKVTNTQIDYNGEEVWNLESKNNDTTFDIAHISVTKKDATCTPRLNVDTNGDGTCDVNCDTNHNGILDSTERSAQSDSYQNCSK